MPTQARRPQLFYPTLEKGLLGIAWSAPQKDSFRSQVPGGIRLAPPFDMRFLLFAARQAREAPEKPEGPGCSPHEKSSASERLQPQRPVGFPYSSLKANGFDRKTPLPPSKGYRPSISGFALLHRRVLPGPSGR